MALFSSLLSSLFRVKSCQSEVVHSTLSLSLPGAGCLASVTRWCVTVDCPGGEWRVNKWCVVPGACVEVSSVGTVLGMMGQVDQTCPLTISCQPARPTATTSLQLPTQSNIPTHSRTVPCVPSDWRRIESLQTDNDNILRAGRWLMCSRTLVRRLCATRPDSGYRLISW